MRGGDLAHDRQSDAAAVPLGRKEGHQDSLALLWRDARAIIGDRDDGAAIGFTSRGHGAHHACNRALHAHDRPDRQEKTARTRFTCVRAAGPATRPSAYGGGLVLMLGHGAQAERRLFVV